MRAPTTTEPFLSPSPKKGPDPVMASTHLHLRSRTARALRFAALCSALGSLSACTLLGGQTGEGGEMVGPSCVASAPLSLSLSEASPAGFSAEEVLSFTSLSGSEASWPADPTELSGAAPHPGTLTLTTRALSDQARWIESSMENPESKVNCPSWLEIDVSVHIELENEEGSWAFEVESTLRADSAYLSQLSETFAPPSTAALSQAVLEPEETLSAFSLQALFSPGSSSGTLQSVSERLMIPEGYDPDATQSGDAPQARPWVQEGPAGTLAYWPLENACGGWNDDYGTPQYQADLPIDSENEFLPFDFAQALEPLNSSAELSWNDGSTSLLTTSAELAPGSVCMKKVDNHPYSGEGDLVAWLTLPLDLKMETADGRWQGSYSTPLRLSLDGAGQALEYDLHYRDLQIPTSEVSSRTGLRAIESSEQPSLDFSVDLELLRYTPSMRGQLQLSTQVTTPAKECKRSPGEDPCNSGPPVSTLMIESATW